MKRIILNDFGITLSKQSERLVVKGPRVVMARAPEPAQADLDLGLRPVGAYVEIAFDEKGPSIVPFRALRKARDMKEQAAGKPPRPRVEILLEIPFFQLAEVMVSSRGVSISSDLLEELCVRRIPIAFVSPSGEPYALVSSPSWHESVEIRREQMAAFKDSRGLVIASSLILGKIRNQATLLKYSGKYLKEKDSAQYDELRGLIQGIEDGGEAVLSMAGELGDANWSVLRDRLMGYEGAASRCYWTGVGLLVRNKVEFTGREGHGAQDPFNSMINYGYGILYAKVWSAVVLEGLEPFAGFLHTDRSGKPSLVLDLVEPFRQPVVDKTVIALVNQGRLARTEEGLMVDESRKELAESILSRLEVDVDFQGSRMPLSEIFHAQVVELKGFLAGKTPRFEVWKMVW